MPASAPEGTLDQTRGGGLHSAGDEQRPCNDGQGIATNPMWSVSGGQQPLQPHQFDAAYLERLRAGDPTTERHFADYFGTLVLLKLRRRLRSAHLIEDIRQETFLRVLRAVRSPDGIRDPRSLGSFVNSVCNHVWLETLRRKDRDEPASDDAASRRSPQPDPEDSLINKETEILVRRVIRALPERDQALLRALFLEEEDRDSICARFGVDRGYLRVLLHRAKNQFRAKQGNSG
jgi:RNA polymerase sigma-70 factor, ECF subfamily